MQTVLVGGKDIPRFLGDRDKEGPEPIVQLVIALSGCITIFFLSNPGHVELARWGFLTGFAGQPFWIWSTARKRQWGMLAVSLFYTGIFLSGLYRFWL